MGGSSTVGSNGAKLEYIGTLGTPAAGNIPGGRYGASSWTDSSGNLWLFGGSGFDVNGNLGDLNDLWEFNPSRTNGPGWAEAAHGKGQPRSVRHVGNAGRRKHPRRPPAGLQAGPTAAAISGSLGAMALMRTADLGYLNDLWEFNPSTNEWTWMGGSSTISCNTECAASPECTARWERLLPETSPEAAIGSVSWTDSSGNLWLFGGFGCDSERHPGYLNDLWEFNPSTNEWAWMGGSSTVWLWRSAWSVRHVGHVRLPEISPQAASAIRAWTDSSGNLWLFGGDGFDANGNSGYLNDLWEFNPSTNEWTWMGGSSTVPISGESQPGVYGTLGTPAAGNTPGGRN